MPVGTKLASPDYRYGSARLLLDQTFPQAADGGSEPSQEIFDTILAEIAGAETYLILDFFLWNDWLGKLENEAVLRPLARELWTPSMPNIGTIPSFPLLLSQTPSIVFTVMILCCRF